MNDPPETDTASQRELEVRRATERSSEPRSAEVSSGSRMDTSNGDAAHPPEHPSQAQSPYVRLPLPLVAGGLLIFLVALFALGVYANRSLRPTATGTIASATAAGSTAPPASGAATATPPSQPTPVPSTPIPVTTAVPADATPPGTVATPGPTPLIIVLATSPTATLVPPNTTPTALPTVEPTIAAEVGKAYQDFWQVTSQALLELDTTHLTEVMDGAYLVNVRQRITELKDEGRAIKTHVILNYSVVQATTESASVVDDLEDDSVYVRIGTEDALTEPTMDQFRVLYKLRRSSGVWKVVDSVRSE